MIFDNEEEEKQNQTFVFCFSPLKFLCLSPMKRGYYEGQTEELQRSDAKI